MKRVILIVLDSLGIGAAGDAAAYGDEGANTLCSIAKSMDDIEIPNLMALGIACIDGVYCLGDCPLTPIGAVGRLKPASKGKDTITGHWEIAGLITDTPFKTYPEGFPSEFISAFEDRIGRKVIGNYPASGTEIIESLGEEHEKTGSPIVYTSADSVFQIAANTDVVPLEELYSMCEIAREMLTGPWACGRVIARPYAIDESGKRRRTPDRKDYAVSPPEKTMLDYITDAGMTVYGIGKISDIFNSRGVGENVHTDSNMDGVDKILDAMKESFEGLIFANLVEFDSLYGHRRDPIGYGKALEEFDSRLPQLMNAMKEQDVLILCADHGNDPLHDGTDHTREDVPLICYGGGINKGANFGTGESFSDIARTVLEYLEIENALKAGKSFLSEIFSL